MSVWDQDTVLPWTTITWSWPVQAGTNVDNYTPCMPESRMHRILESGPALANTSYQTSSGRTYDELPTRHLRYINHRGVYYAMALLLAITTRATSRVYYCILASTSLQGYERVLSQFKYIAGDKLTLADLFHLPYGTKALEVSPISPSLFLKDEQELNIAAKTVRRGPSIDRRLIVTCSEMVERDFYLETLGKQERNDGSLRAIGNNAS